MPLFRFSARIKAFKVTTCNGATCEKGSSSTAKRLRLRRITKHSKIRRSPAGKGSDFRLPQLPEYRKPDRQVIPLQTEVPQNRLHSQPPGGKPLLRKITHLAASETIVPFAVDAHRSESGAQRSAEYLHQAAFFHCHCVPAMPLLRRFRRQDIHSKESPDHRTTTRPNLFQEYVFQRGSYSTKGYEYQQHITRQQVYAATRTQQHTSSNPQIAVIVELIVITRYDPNIQIDRIDDHFPRKAQRHDRRTVSGHEPGQRHAHGPAEKQHRRAIKTEYEQQFRHKLYRVRRKPSHRNAEIKGIPSDDW